MSNSKGDIILSQIVTMVRLESSIQDMVSWQEESAGYIVGIFGDPKTKVEHIRPLAKALINELNTEDGDVDSTFLNFCAVMNAFLCPEQGVRFQNLIKEFDPELLRILRAYGMKKFRVRKEKQ